MTAAALVAALRDFAARLGKVSSAAKAKAMVPELLGLADQVSGVFPPILERRVPNAERRIQDGPLPVGRTRMRMGVRRGGKRFLPPTPPVVVVPPGTTASQLSNVTDPAGAVEGVAFTTQPQVRLLDANNNIVSNPSTTVTAAINTGTGSIAGTLTAVTDSSGIATFSTLKINGNGNHTLAYTATGLTGTTSGTFSVTGASKLAMSTQPGNSTTGAAISPAPAARLQTSGSANVAKSGVSVTAAIASGTGSLSGTTSVNTDANGIATFSNLIITGSGAHTIQFTSTGLTAVTSASMTVSASGNPTPSGTLWVDTRSGGANDIQAAGVTTLAQAITAMSSTGRYIENGGGFAFTTNVDGAGTHALRVDLNGWGGTPQDGGATLITYIQTANPTELYVQWKHWMGATATGGGNGAVGVFDITNENDPGGNAGRKYLLHLRDVADGGSYGRVDHVWAGPTPVNVRTEGFYGISPNPGDLGLNVQSFDPEAHIGEIITFTHYFKAASSAGASDGIIRVWYNGVLCAEHTSVRASNEGIDRFQFPSTFRSPKQTQTEYFWDFVAWTP